MITTTYTCDYCGHTMGRALLSLATPPTVIYTLQPLNFTGFIGKAHICSNCLAKIQEVPK